MDNQSSSVESLHLLFQGSKLVHEVWGHFGSMYGITLIPTMFMEARLAQWWSAPISGMWFCWIQKLVPCLIIWKIWKARNATIFDSRPVSASTLSTRVRWWMAHISNPNSISSVSASSRSAVYPSSMFLTQNSVGIQSPSKQLSVVKWLKSLPGWVKINVNGSSRGNPDISGGDGVRRGDRGEFLFAFSVGYGEGSNTIAELHAIHDGLSHCLIFGHSKILVESDSQLAVGVLNGILNPGWKWAYWLRRIERAKGMAQVTFVHIFRKGNNPANAMAQLGSARQSSF